jgi:hypothetical protein
MLKYVFVQTSGFKGLNHLKPRKTLVLSHSILCIVQHNAFRNLERKNINKLISNKFLYKQDIECVGKIRVQRGVRLSFKRSSRRCVFNYPEGQFINTTYWHRKCFDCKLWRKIICPPYSLYNFRISLFCGLLK